MEYTFQRTVQGPVLVGDGEVLFFHQVGGLQDYIDSDPGFFEAAYKFCQDTIAEYGAELAKAVTEPVPGLEYVVNIMSYWAAVDELRRFEHHLNTQQNAQ